MRRRRVLAAAAAALAVGLSGCGIPDETEVRDIGPAPEPGFAQSGDVGQGPPTRDAAPTIEGFVDNFLAAPAGEPDKAVQRVRDYLTESSRERIKVDAGAGLNVVRVRDTTIAQAEQQGSYKVTLKVDQVGVLNEQGSIGPAALNETTYTFTIGGVEGPEGWYVTSPPTTDALLVSTDALRKYYTPLTIYFWSVDRTTLVPDARYMPNERDGGLRPTDVVDWLIKGPSSWLLGAVAEINDGTERRQNVPYPNDRLEVGLSAVATEQQTPAEQMVDMRDQLGWQLMWSLRPYLEGDLELRIDGQSSKTFHQDQMFYAANAAHHAAELEQSSEQPERFALYEGRIHRLKGSPGGGTQPLPRILLASGVNQELVSAALARESGPAGVLTAAALVRKKGEQFQLEVGSVVGDDAQPLDAGRPYASLGRPVWLKAPMNAGLVVVDRKHLYRFTANRAELERVVLPEEIDGKVTDVAASQDGRRIAVVAGGRVYILGVSRDGVQVDAKRARLVPTALRNVTAVDWSEESRIVIAGTGSDNKVAVWEMGLDGAIEEQQAGDAGGTVTDLAVYPVDPVSEAATKVMYAREGAAYDFHGDNSEIEANEVIGAPEQIDASRVTAPFFLLD
ncbi:LpqB family beta-propeller domain-containing protein [Phytohabitans kaempferiae]|uniref:LpqB family beta-propeller domain-containing protein n=1 Tax=Phytohabitans kaempferiae TaxID=1620943 RepID=A0ABV6M3H6_9ACTN